MKHKFYEKKRVILKGFQPKPLSIRSGDSEFTLRNYDGKTAKVMKYGERFIIVKEP